MASLETEDYKTATTTLAQKAKMFLNCGVNGFFTIMWGVWMFVGKSDCYTLPGENCEAADLSMRVNCESLDPNDPIYADAEKKPFNVTKFWNLACLICFFMYLMGTIGAVGHIYP